MSDDWTQDDINKMKERIVALCKLMKIEEVTEANAKQLLDGRTKDCKEMYLMQIKLYAQRLNWI